MLKDQLKELGVTTSFDGIGNGVWKYKEAELAYVWDGEPIRFATDWCIQKHDRNFNGRISATYKPIRKWINGTKGPVLTEEKCKTVPGDYDNTNPDEFIAMIKYQIDKVKPMLPDLKRRAAEKRKAFYASQPIYVQIEMVDWKQVFGNEMDNLADSGIVTLSNGDKVKWGRFTEVEYDTAGDDDYTNFINVNFMGFNKKVPAKINLRKVSKCRIGILTDKRLYVGTISSERPFKTAISFDSTKLDMIRRFLGPLQNEV